MKATSPAARLDRHRATTFTAELVTTRVETVNWSRKRAITRVVKEVASYLGNTPAVARASYIDPRIIARYEKGDTIATALPDLGKGQEFGDAATHGRAERAVLDLL